jgi:hypothetical protein
MTDREAMKQALEALETERDKYMEWGDEDGAPEEVYDAITALRTAIEQAEKQEPVAEVKENPYCPEGTSDELTEYLPIGTKLYTTPPAAQRQWVGLTDEQINQYDYEYRDILYDVEKMLRENNT